MDEFLTLLGARIIFISSRANRCGPRGAGMIGMNLAVRGEMGPAGGWFGACAAPRRSGSA